MRLNIHRYSQSIKYSKYVVDLPYQYTTYVVEAHECNGICECVYTISYDVRFILIKCFCFTCMITKVCVCLSLLLRGKKEFSFTRIHSVSNFSRSAYSPFHSLSLSRFSVVLHGVLVNFS